MRFYLCSSTKLKQLRIFRVLLSLRMNISPWNHDVSQQLVVNSPFRMHSPSLFLTSVAGDEEAGFLWFI